MFLHSDKRTLAVVQRIFTRKRCWRVFTAGTECGVGFCLRFCQGRIIAFFFCLLVGLTLFFCFGISLCFLLSVFSCRLVSFGFFFRLLCRSFISFTLFLCGFIGFGLFFGLFFFACSSASARALSRCSSESMRVTTPSIF
ncbi:hypothetical protein O5479_16915 [Escherichia coli]|nr:hypothetical protein [Escherichia coli]